MCIPILKTCITFNNSDLKAGTHTHTHTQHTHTHTHTHTVSVYFCHIKFQTTRNWNNNSWDVSIWNLKLSNIRISILVNKFPISNLLHLQNIGFWVQFPTCQTYQILSLSTVVVPSTSILEFYIAEIYIDPQSPPIPPWYAYHGGR